jgi:hypothetical protein
MLGVTPFGVTELVFWFEALDAGAQGLVLSSAITIVGFVVAFQSATLNWREELQANLRKETIDDIDATYTRICELMRSLGIFADWNLEVLRRIGDGASQQEIFAAVSFAASQAQKIQTERSQLAELGARANQLVGRHSQVLFASGNSWSELAKVNQKINQITGGTMWVTLPLIDLSQPDWQNRYLSLVDGEKYRALKDACESTDQFVAGITGGIKGRIWGAYSEQNISFLINFLKFGPTLLRLMDELKRGRKISDEEIDRLGR